MAISAIKVISLVFQVILAAVDRWFMPKAQPYKIQDGAVFAALVFSLAATGFDVPFYHYLLATNLLIVVGVLIVFAIAPPLIGRIEAKACNNPQIYTPDRFNDHLKNNLYGVVAAILFICAARWTTGFDGFTVQFKNEAAFNIVLPLTVVTIFAFVRWQQVDACPDLDKRIADNETDWESDITGFSLRYINQIANIVYLILVVFTGAGTILYMFAYTLNAAKNHTPLTLSTPLALAMIGVIGFLIACGRPSMKKFQAVYLNFLTGTPAALMVAVVWLALLKPSTARNVFALMLVVSGYTAYSTLAILGSRAAGQGKLQLHYYSAMAFAVVLTLLAGALYMS